MERLLWSHSTLGIQDHSTHDRPPFRNSIVSTFNIVTPIVSTFNSNSVFDKMVVIANFQVDDEEMDRRG